LDNASSRKPETFVREATGFVRSMNWLDLLLLNVVSFGGAWSIIYALTYAPYYGGDPAFSLLLTAPGILALLGIYYIFTTSMPRSGGDYVFMSRVLHPSIGLAANFVGYTMFLWFWIGDAASVFSSSGLSQTLSVYGAQANAPWATNAAAWFGMPWNNFLLGTAFIIFFALVVIFRTRLYFWIQNIFMSIAIIGLAIIAILLLVAVTNHSIFINNFNAYATAVGANLKGGAYQNVTASAGTPADTSIGNIGNNLMLVPLWFTVLFWVYVSNYLGGETKNARLTVKRALFGSFGIIFIATVVILEAAYSALGVGFITGANNIYYGYVANPFGAPPNLTLFAGILANSPILTLFLGIGIVAGFLLVAPQCMILMSRILFSYSFDRVAPKGLADVNDRFHTPIKAILVAVIGGEIMLAFLSGVTGGSTANTAISLYYYAAIATISLTFTFVAISAILFPYRRKELYERASIIKRKVAGVPVITWLGIVALFYCLGTIIPYIYYQNLNSFYLFACAPPTYLAPCYFNTFLYLLLAMFIAAIVYYFAVRWYRSKGGMPYDMTFKEIPPE
jgi:amino acid transporter